jgi:hypothetical protein
MITLKFLDNLVATFRILITRILEELDQSVDEDRVIQHQRFALDGDEVLDLAILYCWGADGPHGNVYEEGLINLNYISVQSVSFSNTHLLKFEIDIRIERLNVEIKLSLFTFDVCPNASWSIIIRLLIVHNGKVILKDPKLHVLTRQFQLEVGLLVLVVGSVQLDEFGHHFAFDVGVGLLTHSLASQLFLLCVDQVLERLSQHFGIRFVNNINDDRGITLVMLLGIICLRE